MGDFCIVYEKLKVDLFSEFGDSELVDRIMYTLRESCEGTESNLRLELEHAKTAGEVFTRGCEIMEKQRDSLQYELTRLQEDAKRQLDEQSQELYRRRFEIAELQSELTKAREFIALRRDRSYRDGDQAGFGIGINNNEESYKRVIDSLNREIHAVSQSSSSAKDLTNQSPNQCDGCQAGIPVEVNQYGTPLHRMGSEGGYPDYMACTAKLYTQD